MRIVFFVNYDIHSSIALNLLFSRFEKHFAGIFYTRQVGGSKKPGRARMLEQLAFVEQTVLSELIFENLDAKTGCDGGYFVTFDEMSRYIDGPFEEITSVRDPAVLDKLRSLDADLFVSIRFGKIFGGEALSIPQHGLLNLHSGLLPQYRGVLATFRALMNGDDQIGCTLHWIDSPEIDRGEILATARVPVNREHSLLRHIASLYAPGADLIAEAIEQLKTGQRPRGQAQDPDQGAYFSFPNDQDLIDFTSRGWRLWDPADIDDLACSYGWCEPAIAEIAFPEE
jgi:methionyl-tRNA formyltransferase